MVTEVVLVLDMVGKVGRAAIQYHTTDTQINYFLRAVYGS